jgi:hypothetical protein
MSEITVRALMFFYDQEIGDRRAPGDEWTTSVERAAQLLTQGLAQDAQSIKRANGPGENKRAQGPGKNK